MAPEHISAIADLLGRVTMDGLRANDDAILAKLAAGAVGVWALVVELKGQEEASQLLLREEPALVAQLAPHLAGVQRPEPALAGTGTGA